MKLTIEGDILGMIIMFNSNIFLTKCTNYSRKENDNSDNGKRIKLDICHVNHPYPFIVLYSIFNSFVMGLFIENISKNSLYIESH